MPDKVPEPPKLFDGWMIAAIGGVCILLAYAAVMIAGAILRPLAILAGVGLGRPGSPAPARRAGGVASVSAIGHFDHGESGPPGPALAKRSW